MELIEIAELINKKILESEELRKESKIIRDNLTKTAESVGYLNTQYDKKLGVVLFKITHIVEPFIWDEGKIEKSLPATTAEKIAKSICWNEGFLRDSTEAIFQAQRESLRALNKELEAIGTEISGLQSVYKRQEEIENYTKKW